MDDKQRRGSRRSNAEMRRARVSSYVVVRQLIAIFRGVKGRLLSTVPHVARPARVEDALRESEARSERAEKVAKIGNWKLMVDTNTIAGSSGARLIYGVDRDTLSLADVQKAPLPEYRKKLDDALADLIAKGVPYDLEFKIQRAVDGKIIDIHSSAAYDRASRIVFGVIQDITERKQAEEALLESQRQIEFILGATKTGLDIIDSEFTIRYIDPHWSKVYGEGEWAGKKCYRYFEGRSERCPDCSFQRALQTKQISVTQQILVKEGNRPVQITAIPYQDRKGNWLVAEINVDITERTQAEEALRSSEQIIEGMLNAIPAGVFWKDRNLVFLGCNKAFARDAGFSTPKDVIGKDDFQMSWSDQAELYRLDDRQVIESGCSKMLIEEPHTNSDGDTLTVLTCKVPLRDSKGEINGVLGTYMDITQRRRAEEALQENEKRLQASEAKYRKLIEAAPEAIYVVEDGKIIFCNTHAHEMLGYSREEMLGMPLQVINSSEDWEEARKRYAERATGKNLPKSVTRHMTKSGDAIWVECQGERIEWEGKPAVLYFTSNITERKNAENDRLKYEQYLRQAQKLESLGVLAGGIAHDFNNMLAGVFGFLDLARTSVADETASYFLAQAAESIERARGLTQQLLTFSKGGEPRRKITAISPLIRETCNFVLSGANVKCSFAISDKLWDCNVDRNQIGQVLQNVMLNAIQAMPMGGSIEVTAKNVSLAEKEHPLLAKGSYVLISIKDHGTGISQEMLPRIFDPFFTTKTEGHGLGLAISFSIMKRHNGAIGVESELGAGSTFQIYLPADDTPAVGGVQAPAVRHSGTGRILVMDDDAAIRMLLSKMLESFGYSVVCKENGTATIGFLEEEAKKGIPLSAVILDLTIPGGIGGREVAERVREMDKEIPVFVSSGYAEDPIMANPGEYGITASLSKPFNKVELMEMLEKHMKKGT